MSWPHCLACGHEHASARLANICVGCPCPYTGPPMALSLTRPWPWCFTAYLSSPKRVENRSYTRKGEPALPPVCTYRGELYLHAAQSWDGKVGRMLLDAGIVDEEQAAVLSDKTKHPAGVIVARCCAVAHITPSGSYHTRGDDVPHTVFHVRDTKLDLRWWQGGYALVLADVEALPEPVPCKGRLGIWDVAKASPEAAALLRRTL